MSTMGAGSNFVTDVNKTPLLQIITWFLLAAAVICTVCRAYTKYAVIRFLGVDDFLVPAALLFLIGQSVAMSLATTNGLGKSAADLTDDQTDAVLKAQYAAMLLYIPSLVFSKLPTLVLLNLICPVKVFRYLFIGSGVVIIGWAMTSEIAYAFQSHSPRTWDYLKGEAIDRKSFLTYFEAMNAFTDATLILLPCGIVWRVKASYHRKASVLAVFSTRLLPIGASIAKIVIQFQDFGSADPLFTSWPSSICTQLIQFLSLVSACMLYIRPFLEALTSGFINGDDLRRRGQIRPYIAISDNLDVNLAPKDHSDISEFQSRHVTRRMRIEKDPTLAGKTRSAETNVSNADVLGPGSGDAGATAGMRANGGAMRDMGQLQHDGRRAGDVQYSLANFVPGDNHLNRVSTVYTPLVESDRVRSFILDSNKSMPS